MTSGAIDDLGFESRTFPPSAEFVATAHAADDSCIRRELRTRKGIGSAMLTTWLRGQHRGTPCVSGTFPMQSGSSVGNSTCRTTVLIDMYSQVEVTRWRSIGKVSLAIPER